MQIKMLHHAAFRCRDAEQTRAFYEDFLGLPLVKAFQIGETKTGRATNTLHLFFQLGDGSHVAFFDSTDFDFEFVEQHDYNLHLALEVVRGDLEPWLEKGKSAGIPTRGVADHGFIDSIYFRDPNGYVIELTAKKANHDDAVDPSTNGAAAAVAAWQAAK